jgi:hypothetical protein
VQVKKVRLGKSYSGATGSNFAKLNDLFGMRVWQRPQQHPIDHTKDGCRSANPERQRQNCNDCEARSLQKTANANAYVLY